MSKNEYGVCDECGHSARLTRNRKLMRHRAHNGVRFTRFNCEGEGGIPEFVWSGKGTGYATRVFPPMPITPDSEIRVFRLRGDKK